MQSNTPNEACPSDLWHQLAGHFTSQRRSRLEKVAGLRTDRLRLVLQDVHNPHNVSACLRSAEAMGIMNIHIINLQESRYRPTTVARGVSSWLNIHNHQSIAEACQHLKGAGYKVAAAIPDGKLAKSLSLSEVPVTTPLAICFGNEHEGLGSEWIGEVDYPFSIPMYGMVESLNISVAAAISLHHFSTSVRDAYGPQALLPQHEQETMLSRWAIRQFPKTWPALYSQAKEPIKKS